MKKRSVLICVHLWLILFSLSITAQEFKPIRSGFEYAEMTREIDGADVRMNILRLDLKKVRLDVHHALDLAVGVEKTSSIARRHGAFAAINAGFFRLDNSNFNGEDVGTLMIDGQLLSESYADRTSIAIANKTKETEISFQRERTFPIVAIEGKVVEANGINRDRKADEVIVYTPMFGRSTLTEPGGIEIVVQDGKVIMIVDGKGSSQIPERGFVVSASGKYVEEFRAAAKIGQRGSTNTVTVHTDKAAKRGRTVEDIVAGVPRLIRDGKIEITWQEEKASESFFKTRHPRTAVALLQDGKFLMLTADGRSETSAGLSLEQLAKVLLELGAKDALNLDGGGSTTMFLAGNVVNKPSDKEGERRISSAILVFPR
jgi:exopolysaccharide biosynthesis protein